MACDYRYVMIDVDGVVGIRSRDGEVTLANMDEHGDSAEPAHGSLDHLWLVLRLLSATVAQVDDDANLSASADG